MRLAILGAVLGAAVAITGALLLFSHDASAQGSLDQCTCSKRCAQEGSASACLRHCRCGDLVCATLVGEQSAAITCK
jgi:hypothetical protein